MPLVAPAVGLSKGSWAQEWQRSMRELGIDFDARPFGAICKALDSSGKFNARPLGSKEASELLVTFLEAKGATVNPKTSSHSLKATLLAWAARRGLSENDRVVLGHHSLKSDSLATYSRDLLGAATRSLCGLIGEVKMGVFDPDGTRSGLLLQQAGAAVGAGLNEEQAYWAEASGAEADREGAEVIDDDEYESRPEPGETEIDDGILESEKEYYTQVSDAGDVPFDRVSWRRGERGRGPRATARGAGRGS